MGSRSHSSRRTSPGESARVPSFRGSECSFRQGRPWPCPPAGMLSCLAALPPPTRPLTRGLLHDPPKPWSGRHSWGPMASRGDRGLAQERSRGSPQERNRPPEKGVRTSQEAKQELGNLQATETLGLASRVTHRSPQEDWLGQAQGQAAHFLGCTKHGPHF